MRRPPLRRASPARPAAPPGGGAGAGGALVQPCCQHGPVGQRRAGQRQPFRRISPLGRSGSQPAILSAGAPVRPPHSWPAPSLQLPRAPPPRPSRTTRLSPHDPARLRLTTRTRPLRPMRTPPASARSSRLSKSSSPHSSATRPAAARSLRFLRRAIHAPRAPAHAARPRSRSHAPRCGRFALQGAELPALRPAAHAKWRIPRCDSAARRRDPLLFARHPDEPRAGAAQGRPLAAALDPLLVAL